MRTIGVVTVGRSDYGIYLPLLRRLHSDTDLELRLFVSGMHLSPEYGRTVEAIEADGFDIAERIEMLLSSDTPEAIAKSIGLGIIGFSQAYGRNRPDLLVVLGDRFEMYAAAVAALPFKIPVAHIHGGEVTRGAIDDALRHSLTKLSHLHFVAAPAYARRVIQLGEEPWRVTISGAPSLDNLRELELLTREELEAACGISLEPAPLLVTFHPVTLEYERAASQTAELLAALERSGLPVVFTVTNADTQGQVVRRLIEEYVRAHDNSRLIANLGTLRYWSMVAVAAAVVGNSSSGIIEAPSLGAPVVNVGTRQEGRERAINVIDVGYGCEEILSGIRRAVEPAFREHLRGMSNPYGDGRAAELIVGRLKAVALDERLLVKRFYDLEALGPAAAGAEV